MLRVAVNLLALATAGASGSACSPSASVAFDLPGSSYTNACAAGGGFGTTTDLGTADVAVFYLGSQS